MNNILYIFFKELIKEVRDGKRNFCSHEHLKEFLNCILEEKMKVSFLKFKLKNFKSFA